MLRYVEEYLQTLEAREKLRVKRCAKIENRAFCGEEREKIKLLEEELNSWQLCDIFFYGFQDYLLVYEKLFHMTA